MERTGRVQIWAGVSMLVLCVLVGVVEGATVLSAGSWLLFAGWLVAFGTFLVGEIVLAVRPLPATAGARLLLVAVPVLASTAVVLLSPNRGGLNLILLVLTAATAAIHLELRGIATVIGWNSAVVLAQGAALGPLVTEPNRPVDLLLTTLLYAVLQAASAAMMWSQRRVEEALQDLTVAHVELRSTGALLAESSQAQERLRISRELHDVLGHQLTVLSVELEVASHQVAGPGREHVLRGRAITREVLADVRSVVGTERRRRFDLPAALADVTEEVPHPRVHLTIEPGLVVDDERAAVIVRVVQEVATNTIRHSRADNLWIDLTAADGTVRLDALDDGQGAPRVVAGHGLNGLRERVESLGGRVSLDGSAGFRVLAELPARRRVPA
ncbi:two-component sensor histidine kinase [Occultella glacieicola]|uniref:Two-component sensor histidine kinase n=1 Tax=Occultella glacieicola TaxID=2518684 RepID=A0ABY2ECF4_9MICO|nr:histidine kinase [Occultella glacieicola]TDE98847.1 two-component sensor histidine kinase [Occultella glacieicola]